MHLKRILFVLGLMLTSACGQKGALTLSSEKASATSEQSQQPETGTKKSPENQSKRGDS
ncbi:lipoprotein [Aliikangiella sp. G2MR2-5]|uniref:lipoprotein n=1 Tax=Aliikangiella sp. G2MR2-5 TaxID=2788943 RepID=UPI0018ABA7F5|nr:lipoprotein [Aliikangiella sp. G2MR2-5]